MGGSGSPKANSFFFAPCHGPRTTAATEWQIHELAQAGPRPFEPRTPSPLLRAWTSEAIVPGYSFLQVLFTAFCAVPASSEPLCCLGRSRAAAENSITCLVRAKLSCTAVCPNFRCCDAVYTLDSGWRWWYASRVSAVVSCVELRSSEAFPDCCRWRRARMAGDCRLLLCPPLPHISSCQVELHCCLFELPLFWCCLLLSAVMPCQLLPSRYVA